MHLDNDLFAFTHTDRDYTAGIAFTLMEDEPGDRRWSPAPALRWLDEKTGFAALAGADTVRTRAVQVGLLLFTPQDIGAREPLPDDRPYANLTYVSSSELAHDPGSNVAYQSTLTVGFLGLPLAEHVHRATHLLFGAEEPMGYDHQISDGGEPTFRYAVSRYQRLASGTMGRRPYNLRLDTEASVGYLTQAHVTLAFQWGNTGVPWWESFADSVDYGGQPVVAAPRESAPPDKTTFQVSAGIKLRTRLYDSFLQGQFRDSDVTYSYSHVERLLREAWLGLDVMLKNNLSVSYIVCRQTAELEAGQGARAFTWAGLTIAQRF